MLQAVIIGGANDAGKTTFAREALPLAYSDAVFLNADEVQRETRAFASPVAAGRELLRRLDNTAKARQSFVLESTLSSPNHARRIPGWKRAGDSVDLHFIELPSADAAVARVARRVAAGGHDVPEADIRRRFARGRDNFHSLYKPLADESHAWRHDEEGRKLARLSPQSRARPNAKRCARRRGARRGRPSMARRRRGRAASRRRENLAPPNNSPQPLSRSYPPHTAPARVQTLPVRRFRPCAPDRP